MGENLLHWDLATFVEINSHLTSTFLDYLCPLLRYKYFWAPLYAFVFSYLIIKYKRKGIIMILFLILVVFIADKLSSEIIKPYVHRLRPCNDPFVKQYARLLVGCGRSFSFPSSHASNHFAVAVYFICLFYSKWRWILPISILWAFAISYSQVYVGVHYPLDVIAGAVLGISIGFAVGLIPKKILSY
ncbi:MAG: phosphatase PAP2 family protein [Bacteroidetes bacterium]|nr:phosphatase PAP2 family protein [Bacteroidota bacterium]